MTITSALVIFGLFLIAWAIVAGSAGPGRRATGAGVGIAALLLGLLLGADHHDDWSDRS
jgi:hypothetical protein